MDAPMLDRGWNEAEWHALDPCRWTTGDALLPVQGPAVLEVVLGGTIRYAIGEAVVPEHGASQHVLVRAA
jgi:hypothetical protein